MNIEIKVKEVISEVLDIPVNEISNKSILDHIGCDKIDLYEIIMNVEDDFDIEIEDDFNFKTVQDLIDYVKKEMN